ncbi:vacuolar calcium ion transporter-like protein /H(+) exchanger [Cucurbitaria berberidis CBS 394.84]|uniref:Vacuolar calcium ion transporter n=1 Tax=Cucurbitaria berberidis CBS 394.84 TaxID=1168544 RepID=A0A9P4GGD4_9PLEO|nr:vacuolar calcium ion transporter-like protein /H(+) exchanger [Cucurbitaria berberidis CBS 394.84]KAF1845070.1 vacuolar calcium ion transporter-like protein /H(+) exchanger [Cucurbitaria berberidis CBS 394.84]
MPAPTNGGLYHETTPLIGRTQNHENESRFKTFPKHVLHLTYATLASNYVNVFLVFVPIGIIAGALGWNPTAVFVLNFIAIIPLAALLSFATEELSAKLGQTLGGLMNATFGNAVELIVSIVALKQGEIRIVQASMLGSILSNILLVLGCCFLAGGIREQERSFNETVASTMSSLMAVASASLIIPATLYAVMHSDNKKGNLETDKNILVLSHGTSIILLILYILYLYFQLYSHHSLFADVENQEGGDAEAEDGQILSPTAAGVALVVVTVLVAVCAEFLVNSIDSIVESAHISKTFVGLILIPIVGNAAEHVTAVIVAYKGKMDLAINVAIGSSMQIALFVTPFLVILGWIVGEPMTLHFQGFETMVFFISVLIVNYLIQDGKSNYLEGAMCIGIYAIIALAFYIYPDDAAGDITVDVVKRFFAPN